MKRLNKLIYVFLTLLFTQGISQSQNLKVFNLVKGDTLTLSVEARGELRWEQSSDMRDWQDLHGESRSTLSIRPEAQTYYRARIIEPECEQIYSGISCVRVIHAADRLDPDSVYEARVKIGMMRWDAWAPDSSSGSPYNQCMKCMKAQKWNDLGYWPWWASLDQEGNLLELNENRVEVMEQENRYASESRIDYWAFFRYSGEKNPMNQQFQRYQESSNRHLVPFCFIASPQVYNAGINEIRSMVDHMKDPGYFSVLDGRPLVYFYVAHLSLTEVSDYFSLFRQEVSLAGLKDPYIVLFSSPWAWSYEDIAELGQDAYSEYGPKPGRSAEGSPYQRMIELLPSLWEEWAEANDHIVPSFSQQWDPRPYYENPPTWWPAPDNQWFQPPTQEEFRQNTQNAVDFVKGHTEACPARTLIIKEWNGFTEGATVVPSLKNGTMYIDALKEVIR